jgi:hypothetical protein
MFEDGRKEARKGYRDEPSWLSNGSFSTWLRLNGAARPPIRFRLHRLPTRMGAHRRAGGASSLPIGADEVSVTTISTVGHQELLLVSYLDGGRQESRSSIVLNHPHATGADEISHSLIYCWASKNCCSLVTWMGRHLRRRQGSVERGGPLCPVPFKFRTPPKKMSYKTVALPL